MCLPFVLIFSSCSSHSISSINGDKRVANENNRPIISEYSLAINLKDSKNHLIIWETKSFRCVVKERDFKTILEDELVNWKKLGNRFNQKLLKIDAKNRNVFKLSNDYDERFMLENWVARLYVKNKIIVRSKKTGKIITEITHKPYTDVGTDGEIYFVGKEKFFKRIIRVY